MRNTNCMSTSLAMPLLKANCRSPWPAPVQTAISVRSSPKNKRPKSSQSSKSKRNSSNNSGSRNWSTTKKCKKTDKIKFKLKKIWRRKSANKEKFTGKGYETTSRKDKSPGKRISSKIKKGSKKLKSQKSCMKCWKTHGAIKSRKTSSWSSRRPNTWGKITSSTCQKLFSTKDNTKKLPKKNNRRDRGLCKSSMIEWNLLYQKSRILNFLQLWKKKKKRRKKKMKNDNGKNMN